MRFLRILLLLKLGALAGFVGAALVAKRALPSRGDAESDDVALVAILDGVTLKSRAQSFRGGTMLAWLGGIAVDLSEATLAPGATISAHSIVGGIAVRVPPGWRVESHAKAIVGGVTVGAEPLEPDAPTLTIDGLALLGGIAVGAKGTSAFER